MSAGQVLPQSRTATGSGVSMLASFGIYALIVLLSYPFYKFVVGTDGISYVSIARHYLRGEWSEALNPYWSPLFSWLLIPLLALHISGMFAAQLLCFLSGFGVLWRLRELARLAGLQSRSETALLCAAAVMAAAFSLVWMTPDLLSCAAFLLYLSVVLSPGAYRDKGAGLRCAVAGSLAYFAKAYNFYLVLIHLITITFLVWKNGSGRRDRADVARRGVVILGWFLLLCAPWIALVSIRSGTPTISAASIWNHRLVGPDSPGFPQFYRPLPPSSLHALSMWENPSASLLPDWSAVSSSVNLKHQIRIVRGNLNALFLILNHASLLGLAATFVFFLVAVSRSSTLDRSLLVSVALVPSGYLLVTLRDRFSLNDRYLWPAIFLVLLIGFISIDLCTAYLTSTAKRLALILFGGSFAVFPLWMLHQYRNSGRDLYTESRKFSHRIPSGSKVVACGDWNAGLTIAYHLGTPYYGSLGATADQKQFRSSLNPNPRAPNPPDPLKPTEISGLLKDYGINYVFVLPDCGLALPQDLYARPVIPTEMSLLKVLRVSAP